MKSNCLGLRERFVLDRNFCKTFSAFAVVIYSCIKKSFDLGVVFLKCPNLQGYMDNFAQVLWNMVLIMLKGL